ncbi:MAG: PD-(D/E)XK nuclease family protein [Polyangiaceae bacterium]|jgi:ATP-dependent helicase/nuclease subunit B|nr:PD-(D/E)XK nuclease family protein [Polyangiaceae bacterium]MBK8939261.1 PD-(D/E)XK nuclease family protein [Polyangiaceae bacterium]
MSDGRRVGARLLCPVTVLPTERHVERSPGAAVSSQRRFLERLRGAVDPRPAAPAALLRLLAQRAAAEANGSSSRVGLAAAADATVAALRRAGTTASDLEAAGTARGKALSATLQAIDRRLSELDRADGRCPIRRADAAKLFDLALPKAVTLDGVVAVDGAQREAWLAVHAAIRARGGEGVTMRLPRLVGPAEPAMARAAEALEAELADEPDPFELEWVDAPPPARESVLSAHGDAAEARAVAAFVRAALDAGARPDRVLIVVPGRDEAFLAPLRASLREAAVPSSEAWGPPVDRSPEARSLLSILSMAGGRLDKDALIELLRTPGLHPGSLVGSRDEAEAVAKAERLAARLATLPILQDRTGALFVEVMRDALEQSPGGDAFWMLAALERLVASLAALRGAPTVDAFFSEVLQTVARLRLGDPSARELRHALGSSASTLRAIGEGAVAVRAAVDALEAMRDAHRTLGTHAEPPQRVELASDLRQTLGAARTAARGAASRAGAVRVGELREAPALDHDLIVVTRMTARGYAPDPAVTLLDEVTRRRLPAARRPRGARERAWAREAELAWALASARSVALSYSSTDDEGRDAGPPHKEVLAASLRGATVRREPSSRLSPSASFVSTRSWELARLAAGASPASDLSARVSIERERQAFFADPTARPSAFAGLVAAPHGPALVERLGGSAPETAVPVTFVERALKCPFRAFSDRVLGARRIDEGAELLDPRERGDLLHRALHAAYDANAALPPSATKDARLSAARAAVEKALGLGSYATPLRRVERERAANDALAVLSDELDAPAAVAYLEGELRFGPGEPEGRGPLALRAADGAAVYVKGRIDRVDASPDRRRLRVVDYKSGASAKSPGDYDLQLPIYAKASSRLLAHDGAPPELSAVYITVAPGGLATVTPKREAERALDVDALDRAERLAADTLVRLWRGLVPPRPAIATACTRCDARGLCRRPAVMADGDPAVDDAAGR